MSLLRAMTRPRTLVNVLTDPSVILGVGTTLLMSGLGLPTLIGNCLLIGFSAATRFGTELVHQDYSNALPKPVRRYLENKGAALITRGLGFIVGATSGAIFNDMADIAKKIL